MSQVKNESELLRSGDVSAFSRWDLPSFDAEPHHIPLERAAEAAAKPEAEAEAAADPQELDVEAVKPFTVEELEQIREEAYNEGFATGEKDGFHSGQLKAQQEAKTVLAKRTAELDALMAQLMAPLKQQDEQIEDMLLMLLEQMLRAVLQREMQVDRAQVVNVLRSALKALPVLMLGGFTSIPGAIVGGLIIGVGEKLFEFTVGPLVGGATENWFAYVLALIFLVFRPQGLFGEKIIERV